MRTKEPGPWRRNACAPDGILGHMSRLQAHTGPQCPLYQPYISICNKKEQAFKK